MAPVSDGPDPETPCGIERGNGMSRMLQSFKEEGYEEGYNKGYKEGYNEGYKEGYEEGRKEGREESRKKGMMKADREVLSILFASRFDPGTVELLEEAAEAITDPTVLHGATLDAVSSRDSADILRLFGIARNGSAH